MNEDSKTLWQTYARGIQRLDEPKETTTQSVKTEKEKQVPVSESSPPAASFKPFVPEPLDVRVEKNLSLGEVVIEARLDLHGQTEERAHALFSSFIDKQTTLGRRLVLVITGKGKDGQSVLRVNLPRWCEVPPLCNKIRAVRTAAPLHGGAGAYYILLRKGGRS